MLIGFKFISGCMIGIEYNFDLGSLTIDLVILRIVFIPLEKENGP